MQTLRNHLTPALIVAAIVSLIGGLLLHVAADPATRGGTALAALLAGIVLLLVVGGALYRLSQRGYDIPSTDEVSVPEAGLSRFLRTSKLAASLFLGMRLAMAYEWLSSGWAKLQNPAWTQSGTALRAFWQRAVTVPRPPATPVITYPAYRGFIQFMLDHHWYVWFGKLVTAGELLIGLGLLLGILTGFVALGGLLMNFNYLYAGTTSVNPTLIVLEAIVLYGWRVAGWYGVDRYLLPRLGTPWAPGQQPPPAGTTNGSTNGKNRPMSIPRRGR